MRVVYKGQVEQQKLEQQRKRLNEQMDVLKRSGLDKEAKRLMKQYNSIVAQIGELDDVVAKQKRAGAQALLVCFVAADLATVAADQFGDVCKETCSGLTVADNDFVRLMKFHAEASAQRWNELVCILDEGGNEDLSMFYAQASEHIADRVLPMINAAIGAVMDAAGLDNLTF